MLHERRTPWWRIVVMAGLSLLSPLHAGHAESTVYRYTASECEVALEVLPSDERPSLRLRPACKLGMESTRAALAALLPQALNDAPSIDAISLFLGRVEEYPWLSGALVDAALQSPRWNARRGRLRGDEQGINAFAAELLRAEQRLQTLLPGWALHSVGVEKVLVGPSEKYAPQATLKGKAPFDAMFWLHYEAVP
jgi:hypothetical protein